VEEPADGEEGLSVKEGEVVAVEKRGCEAVRLSVLFCRSVSVVIVILFLCCLLPAVGKRR
jgi:hypothetical protein